MEQMILTKIEHAAGFLRNSYRVTSEHFHPDAKLLCFGDRLELNVRVRLMATGKVIPLRYHCEGDQTWEEDLAPASLFRLL